MWINVAHPVSKEGAVDEIQSVFDVILSRMLAALRASASSHRAAVASVLQASGQGWAQAS